MSTKVFAFSGTPLHASGGETSFPWQVWSRGMLPSCSKADDVSLSVMACSSFAWTLWGADANKIDPAKCNTPQTPAHLQPRPLNVINRTNYITGFHPTKPTRHLSHSD